MGSNGEVIFPSEKFVMPGRYKLMAKLQELSRLPIREKRKTLIYIPKSNKPFWKFLKACRTIPFIVPAITGMAMLDGLPDMDCETRYYGYGVYKDPTRTSHSRPEPETICQKALSKGFSEVIMLDEGIKGDFVFRKFGCLDF